MSSSWSNFHENRCGILKRPTNSIALADFCRSVLLVSAKHHCHFSSWLLGAESAPSLSNRICGEADFLHQMMSLSSLVWSARSFQSCFSNITSTWQIPTYHFGRRTPSSLLRLTFSRPLIHWLFPPPTAPPYSHRHRLPGGPEPSKRNEIVLSTTPKC